MYLAQLIQFAAQAMSGGLSIVSEQNLYNLGAEMVESMGFKNVSSFLTNPSEVQSKGPSPEQELQQMEMQMKQKELEIKAADVQIKQMKVQQDAAEAQVDAQLKMAELKLEAEQQRPVAIGAT
jgi:septal ring factor EnvC (AmiA/AmiB activator)